MQEKRALRIIHLYTVIEGMMCMEGRERMKVPKKTTTSQLLTKIRQSSSFRGALEVYEQADKITFSEYLYGLMEQRGLSAVDMIERTSINRSYFYAVLAGQKIPLKNMILRISLTLRCTLTETNRLLRLAGLSALYPRVRRDAVLIYAVENKATMQEANLLLEQAEEEPLYR